MNYFVYVDFIDFFISCERLYNPSLLGQPVIILSHSESVVKACSHEAKLLGIKLGDPFSKIKDFCIRQKVVVFPYNEKLYEDISLRVMNLLSSIAEEMETSSLDSAFLTYTGKLNPQMQCKQIKEKIQKWVGIPVSIGIAATKTLARIANEMAKKEGYSEVIDLTSIHQRKSVLERYFLSDLPELSSHQKGKLKTMQILTAWELSQLDPTLVKSQLGGVGVRLQGELRGECGMAATKNQISFSRTFDLFLNDLKELKESISTFISGACDNLVLHQMGIKSLCISLEAIFNEKQGSSSHVSLTYTFTEPTNDPEEMTTAMEECLTRLYSSTEHYVKCDIQLIELVTDCSPRGKKENKIIDLNQFFDKNTLSYSPFAINQRSKGQEQLNWKGLAFALAK